VPEPSVLIIEDGLLALSVVDEGAVGYSAAWQAPAGATALTAAIAAYEETDAAWSCQLTSGRLVASKQVTRRDRAATFCSPASSTPTPAQTTYTLDASFFQDADVREGLQSFLYEHDTEEAFFLLGLRSGTTPPRAIGRVILHAVGFGGEPQVDLTDSFSLDVVRKPDIVFGSTGSTRLITGAGVTTDSA
jgi:hypothetical protein